MASPAVNPASQTISPEMDDQDDLFIPPEEGRRMFDEAALAMVGMSGAEFIRRYDAGEYAEIADDAAHRNIIELGLMIRFGR